MGCVRWPHWRAGSVLFESHWAKVTRADCCSLHPHTACRLRNDFPPLSFSQRGALHQVHWVQNVKFAVLQNSALHCLLLVLAAVQFELQCKDSGPVSSPNSCSQNAPHALGFFMPQTHQDKLTNSRPGVVWTDWQIGLLGGPVKAATLLHQVVQPDYCSSSSTQSRLILQYTANTDCKILLNVCMSLYSENREVNAELQALFFFFFKSCPLFSLE